MEENRMRREYYLRTWIKLSVFAVKQTGLREHWLDGASVSQMMILKGLDAVTTDSGSVGLTALICTALSISHLPHPKIKKEISGAFRHRVRLMGEKKQQ